VITPIKAEEGTGPSLFEVLFGEHEYKSGRKILIERASAFVIMSFVSLESRETYAAIKDECSKLGLKTLRADESPTSDLIIKEIFSWIEKAEFIICDLSHERPNVYYELGYAHGVGNGPSNVFLVAAEGTLLHFDVAPFRVQYYRSTEHLRSLMATNFAKMVQAKREVEERFRPPR
jgi:hypothetical protein